MQLWHLSKSLQGRHIKWGKILHLRRLGGGRQNHHTTPMAPCAVCWVKCASARANAEKLDSERREKLLAMAGAGCKQFHYAPFTNHYTPRARRCESHFTYRVPDEEVKVDRMQGIFQAANQGDLAGVKRILSSFPSSANAKSTNTKVPKVSVTGSACT